VKCPSDSSSVARVSYTGQEEGDLALYSCDEGSDLVGSRVRECVGDGKWSGYSPTCRRKYKNIYQYF